MSRSTAAAYVDLPEASFMKEVQCGALPSPFVLGGSAHWHRPALDAALVELAGKPIDDWRQDQPGLQDRPASRSLPDTKSKEPAVYDVVTLAEKWGCGTDTIRSLIKSGELPAFKVGGKLLRVRAADVSAFEATERATR